MIRDFTSRPCNPAPSLGHGWDNSKGSKGRSEGWFDGKSEYEGWGKSEGWFDGRSEDEGWFDGGSVPGSGTDGLG